MTGSRVYVGEDEVSARMVELGEKNNPRKGIAGQVLRSVDSGVWEAVGWYPVAGVGWRLYG